MAKQSKGKFNFNKQHSAEQPRSVSLKSPATIRTPRTNALPAKERSRKDEKMKKRKRPRRRKQNQLVVRSLAKRRRPLCLFTTVQLILATSMAALTFFGLVVSVWSAFLYQAPQSTPVPDFRLLFSSSQLPLQPNISPSSPTTLSPPSIPFTDSRTFFWIFFLFNGHFLGDFIYLYEVITSQPVNLCAYTTATTDHLLYLFIGDLLCLSWTTIVHLGQLKVDQLKSISMGVLVFSPGAICLIRILLTVAFVLHFNAQFSAGGKWRWVGDRSRRLAAKPVKKNTKENSRCTRKTKPVTRKLTIDTGKTIKITQSL